MSTNTPSAQQGLREKIADEIQGRFEIPLVSRASAESIAGAILALPELAAALATPAVPREREPGDDEIRDEQSGWNAHLAAPTQQEREAGERGPIEAAEATLWEMADRAAEAAAELKQYLALLPAAQPQQRTADGTRERMDETLRRIREIVRTAIRDRAEGEEWQIHAAAMTIFDLLAAAPEGTEREKAPQCGKTHRREGWDVSVLVCTGPKDHEGTRHFDNHQGFGWDEALTPPSPAVQQSKENDYV
jgi:hypothetical protein